VHGGNAVTSPAVVPCMLSAQFCWEARLCDEHIACWPWQTVGWCGRKSLSLTVLIAMHLHLIEHLHLFEIWIDVSVMAVPPQEQRSCLPVLSDAWMPEDEDLENCLPPGKISGAVGGRSYGEERPVARTRKRPAGGRAAAPRAAALAAAAKAAVHAATVTARLAFAHHAASLQLASQVLYDDVSTFDSGRLWAAFTPVSSIFTKSGNLLEPNAIICAWPHLQRHLAESNVPLDTIHIQMLSLFACPPEMLALLPKDGSWPAGEEHLEAIEQLDPVDPEFESFVIKKRRCDVVENEARVTLGEAAPHLQEVCRGAASRAVQHGCAVHAVCHDTRPLASKMRADRLWCLSRLRVVLKTPH